MSNSDNAYRETWVPPVRPEWVQRINDEGRCMQIESIVPLDEESLLASAMAATGLSDFGADDWREPFSVFIKALQEEADLNLMGRLRTRQDILLLLEARLNIEDAYKRHPEISDEKIDKPIIILGQGRSGTSLLHNLISAHPDYEAILQWEAMFPCPPPEKSTYRSDPRIDKAHAIADQWNRVTPTMETMHEWGGRIPQECTEILAMNFMSPSWLGLLGQIPSYDAYMAKNSMVPALQYHKRVLKLLQWKNPRKHWVLKDNQYIDRLDEVLEVYPDACLVWPHRDPVKAFASVVNLIGTAQWARSDHPLKNGAYAFVTDPENLAVRLNGVVDMMESGNVSLNQVYHVTYQELVDNPIQLVEEIHKHFDLPLTDAAKQAMINYLAENPRDARPAHKYNSGSSDMVRKAREAYSRYQKYFGISDEI